MKAEQPHIKAGESGRAPAGQALAVPATPANAVDGPSGFDPSRITGEKWIGGSLHQLTHWSGDITDPAVRADLYKDVRRVIRSAVKNVLLESFKRPKAERLAEDASRDAAEAVVEQLWRGYCL